MKNSTRMSRMGIARLFAVWNVLVLGLVVSFTGCARSASAQDQAQTTLNTLLECTVQQADDWDAALAQEKSAPESNTLTNIATERFGSYMTEDCMETCLADRTFGKSAALAQQNASDITLSNLQLTQREGEPTSFSFTAQLNTPEKTVATVTGNISLEKVDNQWKTTSVRATVESTNS